MQKMTSDERTYRLDTEVRWQARREADRARRRASQARRRQRAFSIFAFAVCAFAALYLLAHILIAQLT